MGMPYVAGYSYAFNNPLTGIDASGNWTSNCGVFSQACDSYTFFANVIIGAAKAGIGILVGVVSWVVDPVGTAIGVANSCNAGFAQYGGNGPSFEGFLQCVDNLNPIAGIRNDFTSSLSATNVQDSGQAFGTGLLGVGLTAAPFAKGILPANCGTTAAKPAIGFANDAVGSAYQGMRSGGGHAIRHLRDEGLIANSGSLDSQVAQFEQLTSPILRSPAKTFDWALGGTMTRAFAGSAGGREVVVFVAKEGKYQGKVLTAVVPDATQIEKWGLP